MTKKEAVRIAGSLSNTSKMPGKSYGLPAEECKAGRLLAKIPGTPCADCYALKGAYIQYAANVKPAQYKRLAAITHPEWVDAMITQIDGKFKGSDYFRWHDSGDIQSLEHLADIVAIARRLPHVNFWLPTREYALVRAYIRKAGPFPKNLTVRMSAPKLDTIPVKVPGTLGSTVHTETAPAGTFACRAVKGQCGDCRACWSAAETVSYELH
jgi:hypothetical protein